MSKRNSCIGTFLILFGTTVLVLLILWLMGYRLSGESIRGWLSKEPVQQTAGDSLLLQRPVIIAPHATGSSELEDFYARHPRTEKKKNDPLDTSLWKTDYYTSPDGVSWKKDSNSANVLSETKMGEQDYPTSMPAQSNPQQQKGQDGRLRVEFWESPINYKGYKLDRKLLIIFGISPDDNLRFEHHQDGIRMFHDDKVYLLKPNAGYMPFVERGAQLSAQDSLMAVKAGLAAEKNVKGQ